MDLLAKTPRKRVANFTNDEKALLAQIIKNKPIIQSKLTDGKSIAKKQATWELITREFNCHANVNKRETITLKRVWDNMKALTRKTRATERGNLIRTGGGPQLPPSSSQDAAIISMVEDAAPVMICEIKNAFDSDGAILSSIDSKEMDLLTENGSQAILSRIDSKEMDLLTENGSQAILSRIDSKEMDRLTDNGSQAILSRIDSKEMDLLTDNGSQANVNVKVDSFEQTRNNTTAIIIGQDQSRRPSDYVRREGVIRIKHLESKKKMENQILKTQLEIEVTRKRAALLEEERNKILLEKARMELDILRKSLQ